MKVEIRLKQLENLKVEVRQKTKMDGDIEVTEVVRRVSFDCQAPAGDLGRVISLLDRKAPIHCVIGSDQAALDLRFESVEAEEKEREPAAV